MAHEVYISYAQNDKYTAQVICTAMELSSIRCWIGARDIHTTDRISEVMQAILNSKFVVLILTMESNNSPNCQNEINIATNHNIPIIPLAVDDFQPSGLMRFFLSVNPLVKQLADPAAKEAHQLHGKILDAIDKFDLYSKSTDEEHIAVINKVLEAARKLKISIENAKYN